MYFRESMPSFSNEEEKTEVSNNDFYSFVEKIREKEEVANREDVDNVFEVEEVIKELKKYIELIEKSEIKKYSNLIEPEGSNGRTFEEEIEKYIIDKNRGGIHEISLSYPYVDKLKEEFWDELKKKEEELLLVGDKIESISDKNIRDILLEILSVEKAKIKHVFLLKEWNNLSGDLPEKKEKKERIEDDCCDCLSKVYGGVDKKLFDKAYQSYQENNLVLDADENKSELEEILIANRFDSQEIVWEFNSFFEEAGMSNCLAIIDKEKKNCASSVRDKEHNEKTIIKVPDNYSVNGLKLLQLLHHESWHAMTGEFQNELGLGSIKFGKNANSVMEGLAVLNEMEVTNKIFGYDKLRRKSHPYYIMAMAEIDRLSEESKKAVNPGDIYSFLLEVIRKDFEKRGYDENEIKNEAKKITRRVFKGVPGGRHYNSKDSIYFKGEEMVKVLKDSNFLEYIEKLYIDPELIPVFIESGIYKKSDIMNKTISGFKNVMANIIKQENWQEKYLKDRNLWRFFASWEK